jgi:hypothetical protein
MKRREFVTLVAGAAAWPITVKAQSPRVPTVGFLSPNSQAAAKTWTTAFVEALREAAMPRYYFDLLDDNDLYPDDEGLEPPSIDAARQEAAHSLRDAAHGGTGKAVRQMSVEVRNDVGLVLRLKSSLEAEVFI